MRILAAQHTGRSLSAREVWAGCPATRLRFPGETAHHHRGGFTAMEMVGVMAIVVILVSLAINSTLIRLKQGHRDQEAITLDTLVNGLTNLAAAGRYIPAATNWVPRLAAQLVYAESQIANNPVGNARTFLVDPGINVALPYTQTGVGLASYVTGGSAVSPPANLRFIFLSSVCPSPLPSLSGITFNTLWNTAPNTLPAGWPSSWKGEVDDLLIRRVDLRGLLVRLVLNNLDAANIATWTINGASGAISLPASSQKMAWYFGGSFLSLYDRGGYLFNREVLNADVSYAYQYNEWGRHLTKNGRGPTADFGGTIDTFLGTAAVPDTTSRFGADQQAVVDEMFAYLRAYGLWGLAGFPQGGSSSAQQVPEFKQVNDAQIRLDNFSYNLFK